MIKSPTPYMPSSKARLVELPKNAKLPEVKPESYKWETPRRRYDIFTNQPKVDYSQIIGKSVDYSRRDFGYGEGRVNSGYGSNRTGIYKTSKINPYRNLFEKGYGGLN